MTHFFKRRVNTLTKSILVALAATGVAASAHSATDLHYASVSELSKMMADNELTAVELVEHFQQRIAELDKQGPAIHAIVELNSQAIEIATALDNERNEGQSRGPLHGIPVLLKDNFDTADSLQTSAGLWPWSASRQPTMLLWLNSCGMPARLFWVKPT